MVSDTVRLVLMIAVAAPTVWVISQRLPLTPYLIDAAFPIAGGAAAAFLVLVAVDFFNERQT